MMVGDSLTVPLAIVAALLGAAVIALRRRRPHDAPPMVSGPVPFVGCAISFGKAPLHFIKQCRDNLGPVFTIHAAGQKMTFITEAQDLPVMFSREPGVSFQAAVQPFTNKAASMSPQGFASTHKVAHDMMKGKLAPSNLPQFVPDLCRGFAEQIEQQFGTSGKDVALLPAVRKCIFNATVGALFGKELVGYDGVFDEFWKFSEDFEYGVQLPELAVYSWARCKYSLLKKFKRLVGEVDGGRVKLNGKQAVFAGLLEKAQGSDRISFSLLLLWASQANSTPASFWVIAFLLDHPDAMREAVREAQSVFGTADRPKDLDGITVDDIAKLKFIKSVVLETVRLRSVGMIARKAMEAQKVGDFTIPAGDLVMVSPYWIHRDEKHFPNANEFEPHRWDAADLDKQQFLPNFVAFGGGRYQCPGRWMALLEMQIFLGQLLSRYTFTTTCSLPEPSPLHLVGIQEPEGNYVVGY